MDIKSATVGIYTLGCKVNQYESEAIAEALVAGGVSVCSPSMRCDGYIINTCTVTAESDRKARQFIRRAINKNPDAFIVVTGCVAETAVDALLKIKGIDAIIGNGKKMDAAYVMLDLLAGGVKNFSTEIRKPSLDGGGFEEMSITRFDRTRAYVKIEDGCECKCSYCAISMARGPVRSKPINEVISEVEALSLGGTREIVLTGIETGSYGSDLDGGMGLADLILKLDERKSCARIRLGSMAPELVTEDFLRKISSAKIMSPHIHLSVQSASSSVLRGMKRRYNADMLYRCVENIYKYMPHATITADLMVGFPAESDADFEETLKFVSRAGLLDAHVFAYSKRGGTPAALYPNQVDEQTKQERSRALINEVKRVRDLTLDRIINETAQLSVVFESSREGGYIGHSAEYAEVFVKSERDLRGEMITVLPKEHEGGIIIGEPIYS